jgi:hypothetical protein
LNGHGYNPSCNPFLKKAKAKHKIPELTAGGNSNAEIATLTKLLVWSSNELAAMPTPLKKATGKAIRTF